MAGKRRKRGQATIAVWFPDGSYYEEKTTRNHAAAAFAPVLAEMLARVERGLAIVREQAMAEAAEREK